MQPPHPTPGDEAFYGYYIPLLVKLGMKEYGLRRARAYELAHEILISAIVKVGRIDHWHPFLTGAMRFAARAQSSSGK